MNKKKAREKVIVLLMFCNGFDIDVNEQQYKSTPKSNSSMEPKSKQVLIVIEEEHKCKRVCISTIMTIV